MFKNKTLFMWTISLVAIFILSACGGGAAAPASTEAPLTQPEPAPTQTTVSKPTDVPPELPTDEPTEVPTEAPTEESAAAEVSFTNDIMPIIQSRCINCHGGEREEEGLVMRTYDDLLTGSDNGLVIIPGDPENSLLIQLVTNKEMPKKGPKLTPPQIQLFYNWVQQGALNN